MLYRKTMPNGLRIVGEKRNDVHSFTLSVWVKAGSCNETPEINGISHFIEHMLFKGTEKRTAKEIAAQIDRVGGQINAFTAKECTCFYVKVIDENIELAVDILSDLLLHSTLDKAEMDKERGVILEEIAMVEDTPDEVVHELISATVYKDHPLGRTILGKPENIRSLTPDDMRAYMADNYVSGNMLLSVAGNFDEAQLESLVDKYFCSEMKRGTAVKTSCDCTIDFTADRAEIIKDIEQMNLCWGFPGVSFGDDRKYALNIINNIMGGSMSSRLFQSVREQCGLAYSIFTYPSMYTSVGTFNIYAGMTLDNCPRAFELIRREIDTIKKNGISHEEMEDARMQMKGGYILSNENISATVNAMAKGELLLNRIQTQEDVLAKMNAVTLDEVNALINEVFDYSKMSMAAVGKKLNVQF